MRLSAGSHGVGKALDAELVQLVPQAGLTSTQTDGVIPAGPRLPSRLAFAEIRNPPQPPATTMGTFPKKRERGVILGRPGI